MTIKNLFTKKEISTLEKGLQNAKSLYQDFKAKIALEPKIAEFFRANSPKNIALELFGDEWLAENPLYIEKKKTPLCVAFDNLKRLCKEPKEKGSNGKKVEQIQKDLLYIQDHFAEYSKEDQQAITTQIAHLLKAIKFK